MAGIQRSSSRPELAQPSPNASILIWYLRRRVWKKENLLENIHDLDALIKSVHYHPKYLIHISQLHPLWRNIKMRTAGFVPITLLVKTLYERQRPDGTPPVTRRQSVRRQQPSKGPSLCWARSPFPILSITLKLRAWTSRLLALRGSLWSSSRTAILTIKIRGGYIKMNFITQDSQLLGAIPKIRNTGWLHIKGCALALLIQRLARFLPASWKILPR